MQKIVEVPGVGNVEFPDSMSDDDISAVIRKQVGSVVDPNAAIKAAQAAKFPTATEGGTTSANLPWYAGYFNNAQPSEPQPEPKTLGETPLGALTIGVDPSSFLKRIGGAAASIINPMLPSGDTRNPKATLPELSPDEEIGAKAMAIAPIVGGIAGKAGDLNLFSKLKSAIPSTASAGEKFQTVLSAAKDVPLNTSAAEDALARAQELRQRGSSMPKVLNDFAKTRKPIAGDFAGTPIEMRPDPLTYAAGRDFASNAGEVSSRETSAMTPVMKRQVTQFSIAMKDANRQAAQSVGMGDLYDAAMKEYKQAKTLRDASDVIKKYALKAAIGTGFIYELFKH